MAGTAFRIRSALICRGWRERAKRGLCPGWQYSSSPQGEFVCCLHPLHGVLLSLHATHAVFGHIPRHCSAVTNGNRCNGTAYSWFIFRVGASVVISRCWRICGHKCQFASQSCLWTCSFHSLHPSCTVSAVMLVVAGSVS